MEKKSMELNETMWEHVLYRFRMWKKAEYSIGKREAFMNALAVIYWHLTIRHSKRFCISSPRELAEALLKRGIPVETLEDEEAYLFSVDDVSFSLQINEYYGGDATLSGVGWPENRCICNMIHMEPDDYADFVQEFAKLFPLVEEKAKALALQANSEAEKAFGHILPERVINPEDPDPLLDSWVIEENFRWGPNKERLLVGIAPEPLLIV